LQLNYAITMVEIVAAVVVFMFVLLAAVLYAQQRRNRAKTLIEPAIERLLASVRRGGISDIDIARVTAEFDLTPGEARDVANRVYGHCFSVAVENPSLRRDLPSLASRLGMTTNDRQIVECPILLQKYSTEWSLASETGPPSIGALRKLISLQKDLGLNPGEIRAAIRPKPAEAYRRAYQFFLQGVAEFDEPYLGELRIALGLDHTTALHAIRQDAIKYVSNECEQAILGGCPTVADRERILQTLARFDLSKADVASIWTRLERAIYIQNLRQGNLSNIDVKIARRPGETFHFHAICKFSSKTRKQEWCTTKGDLFISNQRLLLATHEPGKSFEIRLLAIVDVEVLSSAVQMRTTAQKGTGLYTVHDNEVLESTLVGLLRNEHAPQAENLGAVRSRNIPSHVKQQVWARDRGKCVLCGMSEELHYDHDLPFSKGGSNTVENIRLLCARCNLAKRDRIE
jgi:hypothetical protein